MFNPVPSGRFTDGFGPRGAVPGVGDLGFHTGQDIAAPGGTPIYAAHSGVIRRKWWDAQGKTAMGGNMVSISGDDGLETRYAHMQSQSHLAVGSRVIGGQTIIGYVGMSGAANGNHLHFEVVVNGVQIDPLPFINQTIPPNEAESEPSMYYLMIKDGEGRYGPRGETYFATYDGYLHLSLSAEDANAIAETNLGGRSFANVTYGPWEACIKSARVVV